MVSGWFLWPWGGLKMTQPFLGHQDQLLLTQSAQFCGKTGGLAVALSHKSGVVLTVPTPGISLTLRISEECTHNQG